MNHDTCTVEDCTKRAKSRTWCSAHYERWRKHGDVNTVLDSVLPPITRTQFGPCSVRDCVLEPWALGYCSKHYQRWRKHGDAAAENKSRRLGCKVEGCDRLAHGHRMCGMHYLRWYSHGDPLATPERRVDTAGYDAAHSRVMRDRGRAKEHPCVDCGAQGQHWSYQHTDASQLFSPSGQPYSLDGSHYAPRCVKCHVAFDRVR